jgi:hypothetical protein
MSGEDESLIAPAKRALPLPELLRKLGFPPPAGGKGKMRSPFAPSWRSFSISKRGQSWQWVDSRGDAETKGDEIGFLMKLEGLQRAGAIIRYADLAEVTNATRGHIRERKGKGSKVNVRKQEPMRPVPRRDEQIEKLERLARARGLTTEADEKIDENGSGGTAPPFDPKAALSALDMYWLDGSPSYFLGKEENGRKRYSQMGVGEVKRKLKVRGFRSQPDRDAGECVSQIDRILDEVTESRVVDFAGSIAGWSAGAYDQPGGRVLVLQSPKLIEPADPPDDCPIIQTFLTGLLGEEGSLHFCAWLKVAYLALRDGERRPGQALILVGPADCGKSRIQHQIITPILAGRHADPKSSFFNKTDFNAELVGAEHLMIEEIPSSSHHEDRQYFGERMKEVVANDSTRLHKKGRDAVTVCPFRRLTISLNDNPEALRRLPPMAADLKEKIIMLMVKPAPDFWRQFEGAMDSRKAFVDAITRELPAFANYLSTMIIPQRLLGRRYGVRSFMPEEIARTIFENEPEHHLLLMIDKEIFGDQRLDVGPWEGGAEDLKQALCADTSSVKASALKLLGAPSVVGTYLARLEGRMPSRFERHRTGDKRGWLINPPQASD